MSNIEIFVKVVKAGEMLWLRVVPLVFRQKLKNSYAQKSSGQWF